MKDQFVNFLMKFHKKDTSALYKAISLILGALFFLLILPSVLIWIGTIIDSYYSFSSSFVLRVIVSAISIILGLFFLFWTTYTQLTTGKGTPAPNAPTQKLIVSGPYKLCRNPIELGAILYYFGLGTIYKSYTVGIVCFLLGLLLGSLYHKFVEEKELERRFGEEYKQYKKKTPFLIPRL